MPISINKNIKFKKYILIGLLTAFITFLTILIILTNRNIDTKKNYYNIQFESNGGTKIEPQIIKEGKKVSRPTNPIKEGFNFIEWQLNGLKYNFEEAITKDIILTAKWEAYNDTIICTIQFNSNGGSKIENIQISKGKTITQPISPVKDGFTFIGWYNDNEKFDFNQIIENDIILLAKWEKNQENIPTTNDVQNNNIEINQQVNIENKIESNQNEEDNKKNELVFDNNATNEDKEENRTISLSQNSITIEKGTSAKVILSYTPKELDWSMLTTSINNENIANAWFYELDGKREYTIYGENEGTTTIKYFIPNSNIITTLTVNVVVTKVNGISFERNNVNIALGGNGVSMDPIISPSNAVNKRVTWISSNKNIATVDTDGSVRPVSSGTVIITATTDDGGYTASYTVNIIDKKVEKVKITNKNKIPSNVKVGQTYKLEWDILPYDATNKNVTWTSSHPESVSITQDGYMKVIKRITEDNRNVPIYITITSSEGSYSDTLTLNVLNN